MWNMDAYNSQISSKKFIENSSPVDHFLKILKKIVASQKLFFWSFSEKSGLSRVISPKID